MRRGHSLARVVSARGVLIDEGELMLDLRRGLALHPGRHHGLCGGHLLRIQHNHILRARKARNGYGHVDRGRRLPRLWDRLCLHLAQSLVPVRSRLALHR